MTPTQFRTLGEALYGQQWQSELGRALDIGSRHIRRLAAGQAPVTDGMVAELKELAQERIVAIQQAIAVC